MHELSIAVEMIRVADERARREGATRINAIFMRIGPLSGVVVDALRSAFEVAADQTMAAGAVLDVEDVPLVVYCRICEAEKVLPDTFSFCCPDCGTPTPDIRSGRELEVTALEIE